MVSITKAGSSRPSRGQRDAGQVRTDKEISLLGRRGFDADVVCAWSVIDLTVSPGPADRAGLKLRLAVAPRGSRVPGCHGLVNVGRMQLYLPVAEMSANVFIFLAMGGAVGFLSGMFGVGGGFLMTPLLIFAGIPAAVAVGTETAQILASSVSGALAQWRRRNVDVKMGGRAAGRRPCRVHDRRGAGRRASARRRVRCLRCRLLRHVPGRDRHA